MPVNKLKLPLVLVALWAAKLAARMSMALGKGKGSSLPGMVALKICPDILSYFAGQVQKASVLVTGTNGKTTTSNMLARILKNGGYKVLANYEGANLKSGVTTAFIRACGLGGRINCDYAVLEVDEGAFPGVSSEVLPAAVVVNNFFRDQLDRYGELDTTINTVKKALLALEDVKLILNADDPLAAQLGEKTGHDTVYYGFKPQYNTPRNGREAAETREAKFCPFCGSTLAYEQYYYSQLGIYYCTGCTFKRPIVDFEASGVKSEGRTLRGMLAFSGSEIELTVPSGGIYNYYNALAAFSVSTVLGIKPETASEALRTYVNAAGRMELFNYETKPVVLNLVKNPTGFNQSLQLLLDEEKQQDVLIAINDNDADGRDISWLWDVDFEMLAGDVHKFEKFVCTGTRGEEMAVRLKYAGVAEGKITVKKDMDEAVQEALSRGAGQAFLLATYTALWPVKALLEKKAQRTESHAESLSSVS